MSQTFDVMALGVGDTFSERYNSTALLLSCEGFQLAIDCPDMYRRVLRQASERSGRSLDLSSLEHVLITHVHGDHMNGLEGVAYFKHFVDGRRIKLITAPEVSQVIWEQRLKASMGILWNGNEFREMRREDYFDDICMEWQRTQEIGPFRITCRRTQHHVPTSAVLIEANGRTLGYSSDTAFDPSLIEFLSKADLIIHETNLGPAHTPYHKLAELPGSLREKMRIIHYPDFLDIEQTEILPMQEGQLLTI